MSTLDGQPVWDDEPEKVRPPVDPATAAWWAKEGLFWQRHQDIMRIPGVSAVIFGPHTEPVTIALNPAANRAETRAVVRALLEKAGLTPGDYRFRAHRPVWRQEKDDGITETPQCQ